MDPSVQDDVSSFITYAVIEFDSKCSDEIKQWLKSKLEAPKTSYGAGLITKFTKNLKHEDVFLNIGATNKRLFEGAEEIGIKKLYKNGLVKDFLVEDLKNFENSDNTTEFLNQSDCLKVIDTELSTLKIEKEKIHVDKNLEINKNDGIINQLFKLGKIKSVFAVHDKDQLKRLEAEWFKSSYSYKKIKFIPIEKIRNYFGESIAFYFGFFEFYTICLIPLAIISLITWLAPVSFFIRFLICANFNLIWSTIFIEKWKRKSSVLCYSWGLFDLELTDRPRSQFYGDETINEITGAVEKYYPKNKRLIKKYLISYPLVGLSIFVAFVMMMTYYYFQHLCDKIYTDNSIFHTAMRLLPSIIYSCVVIPVNLLYKFAAIKLTDWENHRTQSIYESNLTTKLFIFYFANCFMCLFYEAFVLMNFNSLSQLLISMLIVNAFFNKITEICGPYLFSRLKKKIYLNRGKLAREDVGIYVQAHALDEYEGTYSDYVTVFEQYGYITMFSAVFPWVSIAALVNNIAEQRSDAFKYCRLNKRPFPRSNSGASSAGIGTWLMAFEIIGLISVMSNFALIALHPEVRSYFHEYTDVQYILIFVVIEHCLVVLKVIIAFVIPDEPYDLTIKKQKYKFELLDALKKERLARSAKIK